MRKRSKVNRKKVEVVQKTTKKRALEMNRSLSGKVLETPEETHPVKRRLRVLVSSYGEHHHRFCRQKQGNVMNSSMLINLQIQRKWRKPKK